MDGVFWTQILNFKVNQHAGLDADFGDKLNYLFTSALLIIMTLVLSIRYFVGKVISCWCPMEFTMPQIEYVENYCWIKSTWRYNWSAYSVPQSHAERDALKLNYYQWIPFMLVICSLMFHMPLLIYRLLNWNSGIKLFHIMRLAADVDTTQDKDDRDGSVIFIARYLRQALLAQKHVSHSCFHKCKQSAAHYCMWWGKHYGNYLVVLYFLCKALYLANVIGQFFIMYNFFGSGNAMLFGIDYIQNLMSENDNEQFTVFPRQTWCDVTIKRLYNDHRYTVQCLLPINMFAEKMFLFLWFWYIFVAICTGYCTLAWIWRLVFRVRRTKFIKNYLILTGTIAHRDRSVKPALAAFVEKELRFDGFFVLSFIALNCGELVCAEIISKMWKMHRSSNVPASRNSSSPENVLIGEDRGKKHRSTNSSPISNNEMSEV